MMRAMVSDAAEAALAEYMLRVDRGESVDRARFLQAHPECAADLSDYLAFADEVDAIVSPAPDGPDGPDGPETGAGPGPGPGAGDEDEDEWLLAQSTMLEWSARQDGAVVLLPGEALGPWLLLEVQAEGPVWVRHAARRGEEAAALLLLRPCEDPIARQRFLAEAGALQRALADVPRAQPIVDLGVQGPWRYLCTPPWPEADLLSQMDALQVDPQRAAATLAAVAEVLALVHDRGVCHGDLRPAWIRPGAPDNPAAPLITGFALLRLAGPAQRAGSAFMEKDRDLRYCAPEVVRGQVEVGEAADVYSLGVILYEVLAGRPPFAGVTAMDTALQIIRGRLESPGGDPALSALCLRALHPDPARRPGAKELAQELRRFSSRAALPQAKEPRAGWQARIGRWLRTRGR